MDVRILYGMIAAALLMLQPTAAVGQSLIDGIGVIDTEEGAFHLQVVAETGDIPFGMDFLPDGRLLVASRTRETILIVNPETGSVVPLENFQGPHYDAETESGGMLDILLHPDYASNGWIYYSFAGAKDGTYATTVERARLDGAGFIDVERLYQSTPASEHVAHHSARLLIRDGYLFFGDGDRFERRDLAMDMTATLGKIIRLHDDGRIPDDNPFNDTLGHPSAIWTLGHRNPQGLTVHPLTGDLWSHEHGPRGGDEINIIRGGRNYGWPVITYGEEYEGGPIGAGDYARDGMEQPIFFWKPSIAPSSMLFYTGDAYANWRGNLFVGALAGAYLSRLTIVEDRVINEEKLLADQGWRVRIVQQGPDGLIYIGIDEGHILRLVPSDGSDSAEGQDPEEP